MLLLATSPLEATALQVLKAAVHHLCQAHWLRQRHNFGRAHGMGLRPDR